MNNILILLTSSLLYISCANNVPNTAKLENEKLQVSNNSDEALSQEPMLSLPPEYCRIIGKVISIQSVESKNAEDSPCQKYPCDTQVLVQKVLGYGSSFSEILYPEDLVNIHFAFTTVNTQKAYPNKRVIALPGLKTGDTFEANIRGSLMQNKTFSAKTYTLVK